MVKDALVHQGQQGVQNGRVRLENLVQKPDVRRGQKAFGKSPVVFLLQAGNADDLADKAKFFMNPE